MEHIKENCPICLECLDSKHFVNGIYTVCDCKHQFHTDCFLSWCKQGIFNCPLCRTESITLNFSDKRQKLSYLRKISLKKCSPPMLKELGNNFRSESKKLMEMRKELREYKRDNRDILDLLYKKRIKLFSQMNKLNNSKNSLLGFPVLELPKECRIVHYPS